MASTNLKDTMRILVDRLNYATEKYDEGHPIMIDEDWDNLYFDLLGLERAAGFALEDSPTQKIIYTTVNKLEKVAHSHKMLSLDKTKSLSDVEAFLGDKTFIAMCKMDGLTCSLHYENGFLVSAETRGNGLIGENVLHNAKVIPSIPNHINYFGNLTVDGEIICTYKKFKQFESEYKNPRNFAAGSIRLLDSKECEARNLKFVAWDVIEGLDKHISHFRKSKTLEAIEVDETNWFEHQDNIYLSNKLLDLAKLGFSIVPWYSKKFEVGVRTDLEQIVSRLCEQADEHSYPIDGVVFKIDNIAQGREMGETAHHFKNAIAYKFYDEVYETTLKDIEWTMGRTGVLTPVAVCEPIDIDGSTVSRANLHNISVMQDILYQPYVGQKVWIAKRNMIIPQIERAEIPKEAISSDALLTIPYFCPICGEPLHAEDNNGIKTLLCENPDCEGKLINRIDHFCGKKGLDIKGISKATLEKLMDWGWVSSISDVFHLREYEFEWAQKQGFGDKSVQKILNAIDAGRKCTLTQFISALGIPLIGVTVAKDVSTCAHGSYSEFRQLIDDRYNFAQLPGFGEAKANALLDFDYTEADELYKYSIDIKPEKGAEPASNALQGKVFCITGKLHAYKNRDELVKVIEDNGGKVVNSISAKVNYLINNDINSNSAKNVNAKAAGIPIISEEELSAMLTNIDV